ncbi:MAG: DUF6502 family protein [Woeseiaceae bacterium]|nr:DUF6502 family protein [Woeseiaceae bacterium]
MENGLSKLRPIVYTSLRSLATLMLGVGISAREFVELAKLAYVDAATRKYSTDSRQTSIAKLVDKTGLSKHDVRRLRARLAEVDDYGSRSHPRPEGNVLQHWHNDPDYLGPDGKPRPLERGPGEGTLHSLVEKSNPNRDPDLIMDRLFRYDHVVEAGTNTVLPRRRDALVPKGAEGLMITLRSGLMPMCRTIERNFTEPDAANKWFQRTAFAEHVPIDRLAFIRRGTRERAAQMIVELDDYMNTVSDDTATAPESEQKLIGMGIFYFEEDAPS